ncbi:MAG: DUF885 domain-containing protein [Erythrobacter sp.]|nr:DUF885 domain-containing protein [Erythrobacter sp.]
MIKARILAGAAAIALTLTGCDQLTGAGDTATSEVSAEWSAFADQFIEGYFKQVPFMGALAGRHEYDGQLPDWSKDGVAAQVAFFEKARADAKAMDNLSPAERIQRDQLVLIADDMLFKLTEEGALGNADFYSWALDPSVYIARPYASAEVRMKALTKFADSTAVAAGQIRDNMKLPLPATFRKYADAAYNGYADFYRGDARAAFADVDDPELQAQLVAATDRAADAMEALADYATSKPGTAGGFELGAGRFLRMNLTGEGIDVSLEELERIGRDDLKRNQAALEKACATFAPGKSMADCMQMMQADKPADGPVIEARKQLPMLRDFLITKDLVTIPSDELALVEEAPPYNRQNAAYINIPGPFDKGMPSVYYIAPPDPAWDAATQAGFIPAKADLMFTSIHEIWPGHFLQFLHSNRSTNTLSRVFVTYGLAEGWAHYTEEMMLDAGLGADDPAYAVGQLSNALLRNCRYLSAIGLHTGGMSVADSVELFKTECYQGEGTALQQAARGTYDPRYLNYTLNKLLIRKLREDWTATRGGRKAWKEFHDTFLSYGGLPVPLIRQAMMGEDEPRSVF